MQLPPVIFSDLCHLLAVGAILLLVITELSSNYYGKIDFILDKDKLKNAAYVTGILFIITTAVTIIQILAN